MHHIAVHVTVQFAPTGQRHDIDAHLTTEYNEIAFILSIERGIDHAVSYEGRRGCKVWPRVLPVVVVAAVCRPESERWRLGEGHWKLNGGGTS